MGYAESLINIAKALNIAFTLTDAKCAIHLLGLMDDAHSGFVSDSWDTFVVIEIDIYRQEYPEEYAALSRALSRKTKKRKISLLYDTVSG